MSNKDAVVAAIHKQRERETQIKQHALTHLDGFGEMFFLLQIYYFVDLTGGH